MRSFALTVSYNGTDFGGWQIQANAQSIQQCLMEAIEQATGERIKLRGSGRTDAGVHAMGQVVSLKLQNWRAPTERLVPAINRNLPRTIVVRSIEETIEGFDAIRHATSKRYRYDIWNARAADPMHYLLHWWLPRPLNVEAMREAASHLVGRHDFKAFESLGSPRKTTVRNVIAIDIEERHHLDGRLIGIEIEADGFLYNMVRNIVGALAAVGSGRFSPDWIVDVRDSLERNPSSQTAPSRGLCLQKVHYPVSYFPKRDLAEVENSFPV